MKSIAAEEVNVILGCRGRVRVITMNVNDLSSSRWMQVVPEPRRDSRAFNGRNRTYTDTLDIFAE